MKNGDITHEDFLLLLKRKRKKRDLREYALELKVSFQFLSKVLRRETAPGHKLAAAMGYEQVVAFRRAQRRK